MRVERGALTLLLGAARLAGRCCEAGGAACIAGLRAFAGWTCRLSQGHAGRVARAAAALTFGASALAAAGLYQALFLDPFGLPDLDTFLDSAPPTIGRIEDAHGEVLAELAREYRRPLEEHELPPVLRQALLAAEDKNFFEHCGIDLDAWPRVLAKLAAASYAAGRLTAPQGGSTLTQQLVRVAFLGDWWSRENSDLLLVDTLPNRVAASIVGIRAANKARRKLEEVRLALWLEDALTRRLGSRRKAKEEILRRYAMYVYLGEGRYGFAAASEHYFDRPLATLGAGDVDLAAVLAGIVKSPTAYAPVEANRTRVLRRRNLILHLMERQGFITGPERARYEWAALPSPAQKVPVRADALAAVNWVLDTLGTLADPTLTAHAVYDGRIRIRSTIDGRLQKIVSDALEAGLLAYEQRHPEDRGSVQGSVVVLANEDARVLALSGGRLAPPGSPLRLRNFNRATMSHRQAGSTMKPLVYLTALRLGLKLDSPVLDEPVWLRLGHGRPAKQVANYDGVFKGSVSLRRALAESRNAATLRLAASVGLPAVIDTAHELGIRGRLPGSLTTALGGAEVTLLELANVYRAMASGRTADPWIVSHVLGRDGAILYSRPSPRSRTLDDPALPLIQEALRGTIRLPGGTGRGLASLPVAVMGKTGTTNDFRDALFVGSTYGPSGITMAVRIGFDDNRSLGEGETGGRLALPVFREAVQRAYADDVLGPAPRFPERLERGIDRYLWSVSRAAEAASSPASGTLTPAVAAPIIPAASPAPGEISQLLARPASLPAGDGEDAAPRYPSGG